MSRSDIAEMGELLPLFFGIAIGLFFIALLIYYAAKNKDNKEELETRNVKVLEKTFTQGNIEWYIVECEDGARLKLRNLRANSLIISVGDTGTMSYRGETIQSFQRRVG